MNAPLRTKLDLLLRLQIWALAACIVLGVASAYLSLPFDGFAAFLVVAAVIVLTPALALPFIARRSDPPLGPRLAWLAGLSGLVLVLVGGRTAVEGNLGLSWRVPGALVALSGAWAIVHAWRRSSRDGRPVSRDATLAFGLSVFVLAFAGSSAFYLGRHATRRDRVLVRSDLRHLASVQAEYFDSAGRFADSIEIRQAGFQLSPRVQLRLVANSSSWSAVARYDTSAMQCYAWAGMRPRDGRYTAPETEPSCVDPGQPAERPWISVDVGRDAPVDSSDADPALVVMMYGDTSSTFKGSAAAEGLMAGKRRTIPLKVTPTSRGGVYAVKQQWPDQGAWVLLFATPADAEEGDFVVVEQFRSGGMSVQRFEKRKAARKNVEKRLREY